MREKYILHYFTDTLIYCDLQCALVHIREASGLLRLYQSIVSYARLGHLVMPYFTCGGEKWVTWLTWSLAISMSKGRGQSSGRHLQLSGGSEGPKAEDMNCSAQCRGNQHILLAEERRQQLNGVWWRLLVIHDFWRTGGSGTNWLHSSPLASHFPLFISKKYHVLKSFGCRKWGF